MDRRAPAATHAADVEHFLDGDRYAMQRPIRGRACKVHLPRLFERLCRPQVHEGTNGRLDRLDAFETGRYQGLAAKLAGLDPARGLRSTEAPVLTHLRPFQQPFACESPSRG